MVETQQLLWVPGLNRWQSQLISTANTAPILSQNIYVSKTGSNDTGNGSMDSPFLTIEYALSFIGSASISNRFAVYVAPGAYADPFHIRPWMAVIGAFAGGNGVSPNGAMLVEITAPADTCGFSSNWAAAGFSVSFMSGLGFQHHQTFNEASSPGMLPQLNFNECSFDDGVTFLGPGTVGFDNVMLDNCLLYGNLLVKGWQYLWTRNSQFLGGTVSVLAGQAGSTEDTTWLSQNCSVGTVFAPTDVLLSQDGYGVNQARADLSGSSVVGNLTLNGTLTSYVATMDGIPCSVVLLNGAAAPISISCATSLFYNPMTPSNWSTLPTSVSNALDQLSAGGGGGGGGGSVSAGAYGSLVNTSNSVALSAGSSTPINVGWSNGGSFNTTLNTTNGTITTNIAAEYVINCVLAVTTAVNGSLLQFEVYKNNVPLSFTKVSGTAQGDTFTATIVAMVSAAIGDMFTVNIIDNQNETVVINGNFSMFTPQGPPGPMGLQGPAGLDGYGSSNTTNNNYALFFALMPGDNAATVGLGTAVQFPQLGPSSGEITAINSSSFNLPSIGHYQVSWQVSISEPGQLQLALNGIGLAHTVVGRATGTSQLVGNTIIATTAPNSALSVINPLGNSTALTVTPIAGGASSVSATLSITQLS